MFLLQSKADDLKLYREIQAIRYRDEDIINRAYMSMEQLIIAYNLELYANGNAVFRRCEERRARRYRSIYRAPKKEETTPDQIEIIPSLSSEFVFETITVSYSMELRWLKDLHDIERNRREVERLFGYLGAIQDLGNDLLNDLGLVSSSRGYSYEVIDYKHMLTGIMHQLSSNRETSLTYFNNLFKSEIDDKSLLSELYQKYQISHKQIIAASRNRSMQINYDSCRNLFQGGHLLPSDECMINSSVLRGARDFTNEYTCVTIFNEDGELVRIRSVGEYPMQKIVKKCFCKKTANCNKYLNTNCLPLHVLNKNIYGNDFPTNQKCSSNGLLHISSKRLDVMVTSNRSFTMESIAGVADEEETTLLSKLLNRQICLERNLYREYRFYRYNHHRPYERNVFDHTFQLVCPCFRSTDNVIVLDGHVDDCGKIYEYPVLQLDQCYFEEELQYFEYSQKLKHKYSIRKKLGVKFYQFYSLNNRCSSEICEVQTMCRKSRKIAFQNKIHIILNLEDNGDIDGDDNVYNHHATINFNRQIRNRDAIMRIRNELSLEQIDMSDKIAKVLKYFVSECLDIEISNDLESSEYVLDILRFFISKFEDFNSEVSDISDN